MGNSPSGGGDFKDVIYGSFLPLSFSTRDERIEVTTSTASPYSWICKMTVETQRCHKYSATGFKISIKKPALQHQVILTSGHSVFVEGSFAKRVTISFPGQNSITVSTKNLWAPEEFTQGKNADYNFGVITIPGSSSEAGFNWTTLLSDDELTGRPLSCCGYPTDKEKGSMWITGGGVENVTKNVFQYMYDSRSTSSGSPVYTWHKGYWTSVGIQSYSGNLNSAVRLNPEVMHSILRAAGLPLQFSLHSKEFQDTHLCTHMNVLDLNKEEEIITIGHQTGKVEPQGLFDIVPLSSHLPKSHQVVFISPSPCKELYLSFTKSTEQGGQVNVSDKLTAIHLHNLEDGSIALESASEPGLYLSLSDLPPEELILRRASIIENRSGNSKTVTCHFVPEKCERRSTEKFVLH